MELKANIITSPTMLEFIHIFVSMSIRRALLTARAGEKQ